MTSRVGPLPMLLLAAALPVYAGACDPDDPDRVEAPAVIWRAGPALPEPVTNNAVAALETEDGVSVFSFLGLDSTRAWSGVTDAGYRWDVGSDGWRRTAPVPGPGRLAATAQVVDGRVYLLGGYTVAEDGTERSVPDVNVFDPTDGSWSRGADMPVPVDDAAAGVWRDSLIVVVSGWHDEGNVPDVQIYDPAGDRWTRAAPTPGTPVFGHGGAVVGDHVLYLDGVAVVEGDPRFAMDTATWHGRIAAGDSLAVAWERGPDHPEPVLYRPAHGTVGGLAIFVGGSPTPYNYDGIGYDGTPAEPLRQVLAWVPATGSWRAVFAPPVATMDHRTLGVADNTVFLVGGMESGQRVTDRVWYADVPTLLGYPP